MKGEERRELSVLTIPPNCEFQYLFLWHEGFSGAASSKKRPCMLALALAYQRWFWHTKYRSVHLSEWSNGPGVVNGNDNSAALHMSGIMDEELQSHL